MFRAILFCMGVVLCWAGAASAQSLFVSHDSGRGSLLQGAKPLIAAPNTAGGLLVAAVPGSMFAPMPQSRSAPLRAAPPGPMAGAAERIRHLIAQAEAGSKGYDAVQYGARIKPPKPPTQMRISEIRAWIRATPGQPHAIGRYQFIPATLNRLVKKAGIPAHAGFTPKVQDQLADILLHEAGLGKMQRGDISRRQFMNNLAKIWAGLPNSSGKSHYHGYAGNKATMSWKRFDREMARIFAGA